MTKAILSELPGLFNITPNENNTHRFELLSNHLIQ
jgi:hypothetical protein